MKLPVLLRFKVLFQLFLNNSFTDEIISFHIRNFEVKTHHMTLLGHLGFSVFLVAVLDVMKWI